MMVGRLLLFAGVALLVTTRQGYAREFELPIGDAVIGEVTTLAADASETLLDLGRREKVGYVELALANPELDMWVPKDGVAVTVPTQYVLPNTAYRGLVLNLPEYRIYYYVDGTDGQRVTTYPASIGRQDWETPLGRTQVVAKAKNPAWYPPASIRAEHEADGDPLPNVVPPGPDNPLGTRALRLGIPGYLIHGTNKPAGVGMRVTHGCLRLFPEDIEQLYEQVRVGTPVQIVNQPIKVGWLGDTLWLEVHPPLAEAGAEGDDAPSNSELAGMPHTLTDLTRAIVVGTGDRAADIDWDKAESVLLAARGVPSAIGIERIDSPADAAQLSP